nr:reverse transcriptase domain-containing protein [Tanacetum cinerariifolium]
EEYLIHLMSVAVRIRERKCGTRGGSSKPPVKRKLVQGAFTLISTRVKTVALKDDPLFLTISNDYKDNANACHLKVFAVTPPAWKNHLDNQLDVELLELHDQAERGMLKDMEKVRDQECEELKAKCKAAMVDFDKNPAINVLHEKIASLFREAKKHRANLDRMLLESQKWVGYQVSLSTLNSKVASLEAKKFKLEVVEASLHQELKNAKLDRAEVVSKVVPYVAMELVNSDDMGRLPAKEIHKNALDTSQHQTKKGESVRVFATRYTDDTLQILVLHEDQRISSFVHGLKARNLVKHLSTDLLSTYKGLTEKTYTWIEVREVAINGSLNNRRDNSERLRKPSWDNGKGQRSRDKFFPYRGPNHGLLSSLSKSPRDILTT